MGSICTKKKNTLSIQQKTHFRGCVRVITGDKISYAAELAKTQPNVTVVEHVDLSVPGSCFWQAPRPDTLCARSDLLFKLMANKYLYPLSKTHMLSFKNIRVYTDAKGNPMPTSAPIRVLGCSHRPVLASETGTFVRCVQHWSNILLAATKSRTNVLVVDAFACGMEGHYIALVAKALRDVLERQCRWLFVPVVAVILKHNFEVKRFAQELSNTRFNVICRTGNYRPEKEYSRSKQSKICNLAQIIATNPTQANEWIKYVTGETSAVPISLRTWDAMTGGMEILGRVEYASTI